MREFRFTSYDGTELVGYDSEGSGPAVVLPPGLATPPTGMPSVTASDNGLHVVGFNMRGTHGSDRPADRSRIHVEDHAQDAVALMEHVGFDRAVFVGWSLGVNITFQVAATRPERVRGVLAVGGVPGDTFDTLFAPFGVPQPLSQPLTHALYAAGRRGGKMINPVLKAAPMTPEMAEAAKRLGVLGGGDPEQFVTFFEGHGKQDMQWVSELAKAADQHHRIDITGLTIPMAFVAGSKDYMTSAAAVIATAKGVPHATLDVVNGTHTLGIEFPELILQRLRDVVAAADASEAVAAAEAFESAAEVEPDGPAAGAETTPDAAVP